jgi:hypothetical protein
VRIPQLARGGIRVSHLLLRTQRWHGEAQYETKPPANLRRVRQSEGIRSHPLSYCVTSASLLTGFSPTAHSMVATSGLPSTWMDECRSTEDLDSISVPVLLIYSPRPDSKTSVNESNLHARLLTDNY